MKPSLLSVTNSQANILTQLVRDAEFTPEFQTKDRRFGFNRFFWAKVTGSINSSGTYRHSWEEWHRNVTSFEVKSGGKTGSTTAGYAISPDGAEIGAGTMVLMLEGLNLNDRTSHYTIIATSGGGDSCGTTQYTVHQVVSTGVCGFDYVRACSIP